MSVQSDHLGIHNIRLNQEDITRWKSAIQKLERFLEEGKKEEKREK